MNYTDYILIGFVILGLILGLIRGLWRTTIGLAIFGIGMAAFLQSGVTDYISKFIRYDLIDWLIAKGWMQPIKIDLTSSLGVVFELKTVEEAILLLQNFDLDPHMLILNTSFFCKFVATSTVALALIPVAFILSTVLYWIILRWIVPKFLRKGFIGRVGGIACGGIGFGLIGICVICIMTSSFEGLDNNIIRALQDESSSLYKAISTMLPDNIAQISQSVAKYSGMIDNLNPLSTSSTLCRPIIETLNSMGLDPFYIISETVKEADGTTKVYSFEYAFDQFLKDVTEAISDKVIGFGGTV